jgi:surface carbohydrate biosynthesis protein
MKRYFSILKLFLKSKFIFKNPSKHALVIFDDESFEDLKNFIYNYDFFILQSRIENINKIYFSFKILKYFLKNFNGNIMTAYLASLLEIINPKVVLTNIDNSLKFCDLARILDKKMNFLAIQNASRWDIDEYKLRYKNNKTKTDRSKKFYIPNFLCFGQFEIDHYKKHGIEVKNFFKVGSLRLANFMHYIRENKIKLKQSAYDICLISAPPLQKNVTYGEKDIEKNYADTIKYTIKFCMKNNMKLIFAQKRNKKHPTANKAELNYYKKHLTNDEYEYLIINSAVKKGDSSSSKYSSYIAMKQSKVTVCAWSTMLRENLCTGGKILCCNFLPTNVWDFPIEGICSIRNCTYQEFEERLLQIYSMPEKDYFSKLSKDKCYTIEYDEKVSTIDILKRRIDYFLNNSEHQKNN